MTATQFSWAERRALRWMGRRGSGLQPSEPAFQLLGARLSVRWWAGWATYLPLTVVFVGWIGWWSPDRRADQPVIETVLLSLVPVVAFGLVQIAFVEACRRGVRRIAVTLPHRVSRPQQVSVWTVLGRLASAAVAIAVVGHVVIVVVLLERATTADGVAYGVGIAVIAAIVALTLRQVLRRPTIAVDDTALAVDERLRATDALLALWPVYFAAFGLTGAMDLGRSGAAGLVLVLSTVLMISGSFIGFSHPNERARFGRGGIWGPA